METAEEFVVRIDSIGPRDDGQAAAAVEARDAAVALAALDEFQEMVEDATHDGTPLLLALAESAEAFRAKYTQSGGGR